MKLGDLPIGARVCDQGGEAAFLVAAQNHPGYAGTTLLAEKVLGVRCLDAAEPQRRQVSIFERVWQFGSNDYATSNLHQWLNSQETDWFHPQHEEDCPPSTPYLRYGEQPYDGLPGYLSGFSKTFLAQMLVSQVPVLRRTEQGKAELTWVKARVFLPSRTELNKGDECGVAEGKPLPLLWDQRIFKAVPQESELKKHGRSWNPGRATAPEDAPQIYDPRYGWWYWMRTPSSLYAFLTRVASPYGAVSYTYANNDVVGVRPLMNLDAGTQVEGDGQIDETYTIV
ncbi:hypothetical protein H8S23_10170 [Anaerofilum sp. BX8]|uniref:DUF6273 domain-containing protein n=1 Tax=Anaerofilum hominis TaxID=2763016 RepID=A0A923KYD8_9FIRM|nr:DUF6273 domain-containing protein [Anaerofilum hominis]MBC5581874.1 hypothetical protein [Anaerofilum hominis]